MIDSGLILNERYELLEQIGTGGMANVYKAKCVGTDYYVAVKILKSEYNEDEAFVRKFIAEARSTEGLEHPNIVKIYDAGKDQGLYYIVMELARGMTLKNYIRRYGRLSARETVDFSIQIASAIQAAHDHGIVHRDIKPQNILVSDSGKIKVTDFGIAKAATSDTVSSNAMGSVRYLSPEQARGGYSDSRSDIYSLGITIYEMATGRVPFDGDNSVAIALMHLRARVTPPREYFPDIPVSLENIILKCVRKRPEERYQSARDLISDLNRVFESPDGDYVYLDSLVDDSPTKARDKEEIEAIKRSLSQNTPGADDEKQIIITEDNEDHEDDEEVTPGFEKMILVIAIFLGLAFAAFMIFVVGRSMHLFRFPSGNTTEASTEASDSKSTATTQKETVQVPDFMGLTKEKALERAQKHSLNVSFVHDEEDVEYDEKTWIVTAQDHSRGEDVTQGTVITLTLGPDDSLLPRRVKVPALVNLTEGDAVEKLEKADLKASVIYDTSDTVLQGYVIKQNPESGTEVDRGFSVTIIVSKGVGKVKVPSLSGVSKDMAEKLLNDVGLKLGNVSSDYDGSVGVGDVISQDIPSGSLVEKGTKVSITISLGEEETYHYEGVISVPTSPLAQGESGTVEIVVEQNGKEETIFSQENVTEDAFPMNIDYISDSGEEATAVIYVNDEEYSRTEIELSAVAD